MASKRLLSRFKFGVAFLIWMDFTVLLCQSPLALLRAVRRLQLLQWLFFWTWTVLPFLVLHCTACLCSLSLTFSVLLVSPTYTSGLSLQGISYTTPVCLLLFWWLQLVPYAFCLCISCTYTSCAVVPFRWSEPELGHWPVVPSHNSRRWSTWQDIWQWGLPFSCPSTTTGEVCTGWRTLDNQMVSIVKFTFRCLYSVFLCPQLYSQHRSIQCVFHSHSCYFASCRRHAYYNVLYAVGEGLCGRNVLQLVVDWYCYVFAHNQFAYKCIMRLWVYGCSLYLLFSYFAVYWL